MECKREESEKPRKEPSTFNPQFSNGEGNIKVFGDKAIDTLRLFIPSGKLPNVIQIGNKYYNTRKLLEILEEITEQKIISKRENRAIRSMMNTTYQIPIEYDNPIKLIDSKGNTYPLMPTW